MTSSSDNVSVLNPFIRSQAHNRKGDRDYFSALSEMRESVIDLFDKIQDETLPASERLNHAIRLESHLVQILFYEATARVPSGDRANAASRCSSVIKDLISTLGRKADTEAKEEINPHSPRIKVLFGWFLELFQEILITQGVDPVMVDSVFNALSIRLTGWEETCAKRMRKMPVKALQKVRNPFVNLIGEADESTEDSQSVESSD